MSSSARRTPNTPLSCSLDLQTQLVADGLETAVAQLFSAAMPSAEELMPKVTVAEIETVTADNPLARRTERMLEAAADVFPDEDDEDDE